MAIILLRVSLLGIPEWVLTDGPIDRDVSLASSELEREKQNEGEFSHAGGEQRRLVVFPRSMPWFSAIQERNLVVSS